MLQEICLHKMFIYISYACLSILGYGRIILAIIAFYFMPTNYIVATVCYVTSALLDAFDGHAARYYRIVFKTKIYVFYYMYYALDTSTKVLNLEPCWIS